MPIEVRNLHFSYAAGTRWARPVLRGVDLEIGRGTCLGVLGTNGSGKTTLARHLNGLLLPQEGEVRVGATTLRAGMKLKRLLSGEVGLLFQFPEKQLFAETVLEDVAAGPRFAGATEKEARERAAAALHRVGLDAASGDRETHALSWGEKRLAALAGVIALGTPRLVLDEPGAGLDPPGRERLLDLVRDLVGKEGRTVVFVSHHLDDLFRAADRLAVLHGGRIAFCGSLEELCRKGRLEEWGLGWPPLIALMREVAARRPGLGTAVRTVAEAASALGPLLPGGGLQGAPPRSDTF